MQDRPTASELLQAIGDLLEGPVLESMSGALKHQVRVAGNLCRILERELESSGQDAREIELLGGVLGVDASHRDSASLRDELSERLRSGDEPGLEERAWPALLEVVRGKLAIAKPGHDDYDFSAESDGSEAEAERRGSPR